ncbi:hypothetical protein AC579_8001 [Pseudocercospora musae]|uniref:Uncharacterized protein n=1 Tax=Pseudocercospora musae TaxID=113226 RepID=A0A139I5F4_9PEZI|nr:hypothetical protein AC579_8001 [Pseudocercospora musae]
MQRGIFPYYSKMTRIMLPGISGTISTAELEGEISLSFKHTTALLLAGLETNIKVKDRSQLPEDTSNIDPRAPLHMSMWPLIPKTIAHDFPSDTALNIDDSPTQITGKVFEIQPPFVGNAPRNLPSNAAGKETAAPDQAHVSHHQKYAVGKEGTKSHERFSHQEEADIDQQTFTK